jgi:hypothetical protein
LRTNSTNKAAFERMQRVSAILTKRYSGQSLAQIGAEQNPPVTPQAIHSLIQRALGQMPQQSVAEIRVLEAGRLDELQNAVWPQAKAGDIQAINCVLSLMQRRARLLGLDLRPAIYGSGDSDAVDAVDPRTIKVEIINDPERERVKWLEDERERLLALVGETALEPRTVN